MGVQQSIRYDEGVKDYEPARYLITVEEFLLLDESGTFKNAGRVELIDGEILVMSPLHLPHAHVHGRLIWAFGDALRDNNLGLDFVAPVSARLDEHNLPEADLLVVSLVEETFASPSSIRIAVEVSASSLRHDLGAKARLYARAGLPEYWIADVKAGRIIRMSEPKGDTYTRSDDFAFGERIPSATIPDLVIDTAALA